MRPPALFERVLLEKLWNDLDRSAIDICDYHTRFKRELDARATDGPARAAGRF